MVFRDEEAPLLSDDPLWFKDAIIYEVPVRAFFDSNADGVGDFSGLVAKLDYVQDLGAKKPYSGIGIYSAAFVPANLRVAPGDVLDFVGTYQENKNIGTAVFPAGQILPQLFKPVGTFRFEGAKPEPLEIET